MKNIHKYYSFIREGYDPQPLEWHSIKDCLPKLESDDIHGDEYSSPVLVYLKNGMSFTAYLSKWEDYGTRWILCGRDGYNAENVTHWRWLPVDPKNL